MSIFQDIVSAIKGKQDKNKSMSFTVGEGLAPQQKRVADATVKANIAKQEAERANSSIGIAKETVRQMPKEAGKVVATILQAIPRAVATVGTSAGEAVIPGTTYEEPIPTQDTKVGKFLFGDKPIKTFQQQIPEGRKFAEEKVGIPSKFSGVAVTPIIIGSTVWDLTGFGGAAKKSIAKNLTGDIVENLVKSNTDEAVESILKNQLNVSDKKLLNELIPKLTASQNADDVFKSLGVQATKGSFGEIGTSGLFQQVLDDPTIPESVKKATRGNYLVYTDLQAIEDASNLFKQGENAVYKAATQGDLDKGAVTAGSILYRELLERGDTEMAIDLLEKMAERATKSGQANQALSMFSKSTPEGMVAYAKKILERAGVEDKMTKDFTEKIYKSMTDVVRIADPEERAFETAKVLKEIADQVPSSIARKLSTIQTIGQLIAPKTAIRNIIGNTGMAVAETVKSPIAGALDYATSFITKKRTTSMVPQVRSYWDGFKKGAKLGFRDVKAGVNTSNLATQADLPTQRTFTKGILGGAEKLLDFELRVPDRAQYQAIFDASLAKQMKANNTLKPTKEMLDTAHYDGLYATFQDESALANAFTTLKKGLNYIGAREFGLGDFVLKYPRTPGNILSRGIAYSPAGFFNTVFELGRPLFTKEPFRQKRFVESTARAITGTTGLIGTGAALYKLGIITGKKSEDFDQQGFEKAIGRGQYKINIDGLKRFILSGFDPNQAKIKGGDRLVSYDWLQPAAMGIAIGANYAASEGSSKSFLGSVFDSIKDPTSYLSGIDTLAEQPLIQGITNPIVYADKDKILSGALSEIAKSIPASFIPQLVNQIRQVTDPTARDFVAKGDVFQETLNRVKNKIPGLSTQLPEKVDVRGNTQKIFEKPNIFNIFVNPAMVTRFKDDPDVKLVLDIMGRTGSTEQFPRQIKRTINVNNVNVPIDGKQRADIQRYVGQTTKEIWTKLYNNPQLEQLSDEEKIEEMAQIMTAISQAARMQIFGHEPSRLESYTREILNKYPYYGETYDVSTK